MKKLSECLAELNYNTLNQEQYGMIRDMGYSQEFASLKRQNWYTSNKHLIRYSGSPSEPPKQSQIDFLKTHNIEIEMGDTFRDARKAIHHIAKIEGKDEKYLAYITRLDKKNERQRLLREMKQKLSEAKLELAEQLEFQKTKEQLAQLDEQGEN